MKGYTSKRPKKRIIPNSKKIVAFLWIIIFLNEKVGNLLINKSDVDIKNTGTKISKLILMYSKFVKLIIKGVNTKIPPAGEGTPSKKLSLHDGSWFELTLNLANLNATQIT